MTKREFKYRVWKNWLRFLSEPPNIPVFDENIKGYIATVKPRRIRMPKSFIQKVRPYRIDLITKQPK